MPEYSRLYKTTLTTEQKAHLAVRAAFDSSNMPFMNRRNYPSYVQKLVGADVAKLREDEVGPLTFLAESNGTVTIHENDEIGSLRRRMTVGVNNFSAQERRYYDRSKKLDNAVTFGAVPVSTMSAAGSLEVQDKVDLLNRFDDMAIMMGSGLAVGGCILLALDQKVRKSMRKVQQLGESSEVDTEQAISFMSPDNLNRIMGSRAEKLQSNGQIILNLMQRAEYKEAAWLEIKPDVFMLSSLEKQLEEACAEKSRLRKRAHEYGVCLLSDKTVYDMVRDLREEVLSVRGEIIQKFETINSRHRIHALASEMSELASQQALAGNGLVADRIGDIAARISAIAVAKEGEIKKMVDPVASVVNVVCELVGNCSGDDVEFFDVAFVRGLEKKDLSTAVLSPQSA